MERRSVLKMAVMAVPGVGPANDHGKKTCDAPELDSWWLAGLKEEIWENAKYPGRFQRMCPKHYWSEHDSWTHTYALYWQKDGRDMPIHAIGFCGELVFPRVTFQDLMSRLAPRTWSDLKFGYTIHSICLSQWMCPERYAFKEPLWNDPLGNWPRFTPMPAVDALLGETRGALLWADQLHDLFVLFGPDFPYFITFPEREPAIRFRLNLHTYRKEKKTWELARKLRLDNGPSLADVMEERMIFGYTICPHVHGLSALVEYFVSQNSGQAPNFLAPIHWQ